MLGTIDRRPSRAGGWPLRSPGAPANHRRPRSWPARRAVAASRTVTVRVSRGGARSCLWSRPVRPGPCVVGSRDLQDRLLVRVDATSDVNLANVLAGVMAHPV